MVFFVKSFSNYNTPEILNFLIKKPKNQTNIFLIFWIIFYKIYNVLNFSNYNTPEILNFLIKKPKT